MKPKVNRPSSSTLFRISDGSDYFEAFASFIHSSGALQPLLDFCRVFFSDSLSFTQSVGLLGRGISPSQDQNLHTGQYKHRINAHTHMHASSGIRTHHSSV
jgi:hypothetical protein